MKLLKERGWKQSEIAEALEVSKARKRLPSRQLVAWLDSVFSIVGFVIPMSLNLYAEICKSISRFIANSSQ